MNGSLTRSDIDLDHLDRLGQLPGEGVLTPSSPDDQDAQFLRAPAKSQLEFKCGIVQSFEQLCNRLERQSTRAESVARREGRLTISSETWPKVEVEAISGRMGGERG